MEFKIRESCQMNSVVNNLYDFIYRYESYIIQYRMIQDKVLKSIFAIGIFLQWDKEYEQQIKYWNMISDEIDKFNKYITENKITNKITVNGRLARLVSDIESIMYDAFDGFDIIIKNVDSMVNFIDKYSQYEGMKEEDISEFREKIKSGLKKFNSKKN